MSLEAQVAANHVVLSIDDFGIEYVGDEHVQYLQRVLEEHYTITTDWKGEKIAGIDLEFNYLTKIAFRNFC